MPLIFLLLLAVPIAELIAIVYIARAIGAPETILLLIVVSVVGAWLVKLAGIGVWRRFMSTAASGQAPHREIVDGVLLLGAGALLLVPGFVTGAFGLLLLAPPSRSVVRNLIIKRIADGGLAKVPGASRVFARGQVFDTSGSESRVDDHTEPPPELRP